VRTVKLVEESLPTAFIASVAERFRDRFVGLLLSPEPGKGSGLLIRQCSMVHMFFMRYPIDVIFLDRSHKIIGIEAGLKPFRISKSYKKAVSALEVRAGEAAPLKIGMMFSVTEI